MQKNKERKYIKIRQCMLIGGLLWGLCMSVKVEAADFGHVHNGSCYGNVMADCNAAHSSGTRTQGTTAHCGACNASTSHTMYVYWDKCYGTGQEFELGGKRVCSKCGGTSYSWGGSQAGKHQTMQSKIVCGKSASPTGRLRLSQSTKEWTNGEVILEAAVEILNQELIINNKPYSWDEMTNWTSESKKTVEHNGTYVVYARNSTGQTVAEKITVANIDRAAPQITQTSFSTTEWITGDILITLQVQDLQEDQTQGCGLAEEYISFDEGNTWGSTAEFTAGSNGTYAVWLRDVLGNVTQADVAVTNIDKQSPIIIDIKPVEEGWQKEEVTLHISAEDEEEGSGLAALPYSMDKEQWQVAPDFTFTENGTGVFYVKDTAGNVVEQEYKVCSIDRTPPVIDGFKEDINKTEKEKVYLRIQAQDLQEDGSRGCGLHEQPFSFDEGQTWVSQPEFWLHAGNPLRILVRDALENQMEQALTLKREEFPYTPPKPAETGNQGGETTEKKPEEVKTEKEESNEEPAKDSLPDAGNKDTGKGETEKEDTKQPAVPPLRTKLPVKEEQVREESDVRLTKEESVEIKTVKPVKWYKTPVAKVTFAFGTLFLLVGGGGVFIWILYSRVRILCYDGKKAYKRLGSVFLQKEENGYLISIPDFMLEASQTTQYRIMLPLLFAKSRENAPLLVETSERKVALTVQECIDFVL